MPTESTCPPQLAAQIERIALSQGGKRDSKGWLGVLCPYPHARDKAGLHAWLSPQSNFIQCNGKHQDIHWRDICAAWGIAIPDRPDYQSTKREKDRPLISREVAPRDLPYHNSDWSKWLMANDKAVDYLFKRGLSEYAMLYYGLGYTGRDAGLPTWAWDKIAIPWLRDGQVVAVKLRYVGQPPEGQDPYVSVTGSDYSGWFNHAPSDCPFYIVQETELDALVLSGIVGWEHASIASPAGTVSNELKLFPLMDKALFALGDKDKAGYSFNAKIKQYRPDATILTDLWLPTGYKDFGQATHLDTALARPPQGLEYFLHPRLSIGEQYR